MLVVILVSIAGLHWLSSTVTDYPASHFNRGRNAVWLEHAWAGDAHDAAAYDRLASRLLQEQVGFLFVHVGPLPAGWDRNPGRHGLCIGRAAPSRRGGRRGSGGGCRRAGRRRMVGMVV